MASSHKISFMISCISFSAYTMEQQSLSTPTQQSQSTSTHQTQTNLNQKYYYDINTTYKKAYNALENYDRTKNQSVKDIFEIITTAKNLQNKGINDEEFGKFAYKQQPINKKIYFATNPYKSLYISVFFERIAQYNGMINKLADIKKDDFIVPTLEYCIQHKKNNEFLAAIDTAITFGILIHTQKIDPENKIIKPIPDGAKEGLQKFEELMKHIEILQQTPPEEIKTIAKLLYSHKSPKL